MFKCYFPKLQEFSIDENGKETSVKNAKAWSDPVIWKIKHAPILFRDRQSLSRRRMINYGINSEVKGLELIKYK